MQAILFHVEKDYYTTREIAELYHVTPGTVCSWIRKGRLQGEMWDPTSKKAKTNRGRYRISPQAVQEVEKHQAKLFEASRRYWPSLLARMQQKQAENE
jgi:transposase